MTKQLYWEDTEKGQELTPLTKVATTQMLVKWAGASGDFNPLHYDGKFAVSVGLERPVVHGALKRQWLIQLVTDWMGEEGFLSKFSCRYKSMDYPRQMKTISEPEDGECWRCLGTVTKKYTDNDNFCVDCKVWLENGSGETTTTGKATVLLPSRG